MRTVTYLAGAALFVVVVGGAVLAQRSAADGPASAGQEGSAVTSSHDAVPNDEFGVEDDYDLSLEDPVIEDGEPTTWEEFARDAAVGQHPDDVPVAGGGRDHRHRRGGRAAPVNAVCSVSGSCGRI